MAECDSKSSETQVQYEKSAEEYSNHCTITGDLQETSTKLSSCLEDVNNTQMNDPGVREKLSPIGLSSSAMEADSSVMSLSGEVSKNNLIRIFSCLNVSNRVSKKMAACRRKREFFKNLN